MRRTAGRGSGVENLSRLIPSALYGVKTGSRKCGGKIRLCLRRRGRRFSSCSWRRSGNWAGRLVIEYSRSIFFFRCQCRRTRSMAQRGKKKKEKELLATHSKLLNTWIENFDSRNIFSSREYMFLEKLKERERRRLRGGGSV